MHLSIGQNLISPPSSKEKGLLAAGIALLSLYQPPSNAKMTDALLPMSALP
jgi:hypothetical protein